ncbi:glycosyl hydrolase 115 family protein [Croceibacterium ferulae]|uniref:glycosyl hydrolase 115 family protein n=1 Tax=Croceibacterium ferulae TaxID=1854641 RepID=UPI000EB346E6|nr:glycosyl hydrolase 115 family protein [Croceibacterium ferulae]
MRLRWLLAPLCATVPCLPAAAEEMVLFDGAAAPTIVHGDDTTARLAAELLARDLFALTGRTADLATDPARCAVTCIIIGQHDAPLIAGLGRAGATAGLAGKWEQYRRSAFTDAAGRRILLIAGSDPRGTVWGVVDLTRDLGISAWEWWADVTPRKVGRLVVDAAPVLSKEPSVRYRGIFLNDEDWGLQPWAAKTYEPETGDIGPKTYARIFELLWRLKANTIWPAMHDSTRPFWQIPGNAAAARDHAIVLGTSHAEPMNRNNVREWEEAERGPFNWFTNRDALLGYWRERAVEARDQDTITSIGLRGKHDSGMEGASTAEEARDATAAVIAAQRDLLAQVQGRPPQQVPQALTLYKEVLDTYNAGLAVPDDVTLVWPDDNYGYIHQLPDAAERQRSGGSGVYYHLSYWGRPHDYLWLATTHPALVREQMQRAWHTGARRIWIANVGDIKPAEYLTHYFLDLAFDAGKFDQTPDDHLRGWAAAQFGADAAAEIAGIMNAYYGLAWERRPEFMGWGQTEPTRPNRVSDYVRTGGEEAERRLDAYAALVSRAEALGATLPADRQDAFFQLVLYPVRAAASLNERILKLDLAATHAGAQRAPVPVADPGGHASRHAGVPRADMAALAQQARAAHARIVEDTATYNSMAGGKWAGMMDMAPRRLPVFQEPSWPGYTLPQVAACGLEMTDLALTAGRPATRAFTLYSGGVAADWALSGLSGATASASSGRLDEGNGFRTRITLAYDGAETLAGGTITCGERQLQLAPALLPADPAPAFNAIIGLPAIAAKGADWEVVPGLGTRAGALRSRLDLPKGGSGAAPLAYNFTTTALQDARLRIVAIPAHMLTGEDRMRIVVRVDGGEATTLDFTTHGRSEEWKANVLSNTALRHIALPQLPAGRHRVEIVPLDPGVLLDRIELHPDTAPDYYGAVPAMQPVDQ